MTPTEFRLGLASGFAGTMLTFAVAAATGGLAQDVKYHTTDLDKLYRESIFDAAVKRPWFDRELTPIDTGQGRVTVVTLINKELQTQEPAAIGEAERYILRLKRTNGDKVLLKNAFVSLPQESRPACKGKKDPLLALQQVLGLPPNSDPDFRVVRFKADPEDIFRPCASGPDITTSKCKFDVPKDLDPQHQEFMFNQMWSSYRVRFQWPGYPFTGMGWSYNWDLASDDHFGVSEYVVRRGAQVTDITNIPVAVFCNGG